MHLEAETPEEEPVVRTLDWQQTFCNLDFPTGVTLTFPDGTAKEQADAFVVFLLAALPRKKERGPWWSNTRLGV